MSAHVLQIVDGTTTFVLSSSDKYVTRYNPAVPMDLQSPVTEKVGVRFTNSTSTIQGNLAILNRLFHQAESYELNRSGPRVYIEFDPGNSGTKYRSRLLKGTANLNDNSLGVEWNDASIEFELNWTRQPFWEGSLTQIPLTNLNGTDDISGLEVENSYQPGTTNNFVDIKAADVIGDLPGPIQIEMFNATDTADDTDEIYIFHNVHSNPSTFVHILEAEDGTGTPLTEEADATSSAGDYGQLDWAVTTETMLEHFDLTTANISAAAGGKFAILARWATLFPYDDCWLRVNLETPTDYDVITRGNLSLASQIASGRELTLLETMRLPPYLDTLTALKEMVLTLYGKRNNATNSIPLDYIQLSPISGDQGYLRFKSVNHGVPYGTTFIHDATESYTYRIDGSDKKIAEFAQWGGPIELVPNKDQRLYFNTSDYLGYAKINQQWNIKLWYRPRRYSV